jgi:hypothetical protein
LQEAVMGATGKADGEGLKYEYLRVFFRFGGAVHQARFVQECIEGC